MIPEGAFALDGLLETMLTILDQWEVFPGRMESELEAQLPFLASTTVLMKALQKGLGRETAHSLVKKHALAAARDLREGKADAPSLAERWANEPELGLSASEIEQILIDVRCGVGLAREQIHSWISSLAPWIERFPSAADYQPKRLL